MPTSFPQSSSIFHSSTSRIRVVSQLWDFLYAVKLSLRMGSMKFGSQVVQLVNCIDNYILMISNSVELIRDPWMAQETNMLRSMHVFRSENVNAPKRKTRWIFIVLKAWESNQFVYIGQRTLVSDHANITEAQLVAYENLDHAESNVCLIKTDKVLCMCIFSLNVKLCFLVESQFWEIFR